MKQIRLAYSGFELVSTSSLQGTRHENGAAHNAARAEQWTVEAKTFARCPEMSAPAQRASTFQGPGNVLRVQLICLEVR